MRRRAATWLAHSPRNKSGGEIVAVVAQRVVVFLFLLSTTFLTVQTSSTSMAHAAMTSRVERLHQATSASWAVIAQGRNQPTTRAPYILVWSVASGTAYNYFELRNVGTISIHSITVVITRVRISGNTKANEIYFERCVGGSWSPATNTCSGSVVEVGRASQGQFLLTGLDLPITAFVDMRARTLPNSQSVYETTLDTHISRDDARSAEVRNS